MTTLADLKVGDAFLLLSRVNALDQVTGMTLIFYGPAHEPQGQLIVAPDGTFSGQLANPPNQIPVHVVPRFRAISVGNVMVNDRTGETMVIRQVQILADGSYQWASSTMAGAVWYTVDEWTVSGNANVGN